MDYKDSLMQPITCKHDRPVTSLTYNREGDIIFASDKSGGVSAYWSENGERIGTYNGRKAAFTVDVNSTTTRVLAGYADNTARLFDARTGDQLFVFDQDTLVRSVKFSQQDQYFCAVTDAILKYKACINVYELAVDPRDQTDRVCLRLEEEGHKTKINSVLWGYRDHSIIASNSAGHIKVYDTETGQISSDITAHSGPIPYLRADNKNFTFISASTDGKAKLFDQRSLEVIQTYDVGRPINCAAISPLMDHVIMGGGERAENVTTSAGSAKQFMVRFYHAVYGVEIGHVLGHFGPVNVLDFAPDGKSFASGGEDGYVRIRHFPPSYLTRKADMRAQSLV